MPYGFFPLPASSNKANAGAAFALFWDVNVGATRGSQFVTYMKEGFFIDDQTTEIEIEFVTFNPALQLFAYVYAQIDFHVSGRIMLKYEHLTRCVVVASPVANACCVSVMPSPRSTWSHGRGTPSASVWRRCWVCASFAMPLSCFAINCALVEGVSTAASTSNTWCVVWCGLQSITQRFCLVCNVTYRVGVHAGAAGAQMWTMIEFCNVTLMAAVFVARVHHYLAEVKPFTYQTRYELYGPRVWTNKAEAQPFMLETNESEYLALRTMLDSAQRMANFQSTYLSLCGIITMLLILRLLKLLDFQPRLGLVWPRWAYAVCRWWC